METGGDFGSHLPEACPKMTSLSGFFRSSFQPRQDHRGWKPLLKL